MRAIQTSTTLSQNDREQEDSLMNSSTSVSTHSTTTHIKKTESMRLKITLSTCSHQTTPKCAIPIRAVFTRFLANSTSSLMTMTTRKDFWETKNRVQMRKKTFATKEGSTLWIHRRVIRHWFLTSISSNIKMTIAHYSTTENRITAYLKAADESMTTLCLL